MLWYEVAFWTQLVIFCLYGFEPAKAIEEEYEVTSSKTEGAKEYVIDFGDDEEAKDIFGEDTQEN